SVSASGAFFTTDSVIPGASRPITVTFPSRLSTSIVLIVTPGAGAMSTLSRSIETSCARTGSGSSNRRSSRFTVAPLARSGALLRLARLHLARSRSSRASLTRLHTSAHDRLLQIIDLAPVAGVQRLLRLEVPRGAAGRGAQALDRGVDVGEV